jgi:hypothetical protein
VALERPGAILTASDFVYKKKTVPVLYYSGMVIPKTRLNFSKDDKTAALKLAGAKCAIRFDGSTKFFLKAGGKDVRLKRTKMGLEGIPIDLGKGRKYQIGFPRAFTYLKKGAMYVRSGCVQQVKLGDGIACLYDDNMDGAYDSRHDMVRIGEAGTANVFAPIGAYLPGAKAIHKVNGVAGDGSALKCAAHEGDIGKVKLDFPVKNVEGHFAVASADGKVSFGVKAAGQTLTVLPGKYTLLYGLVFEPKNKNVLALILPGDMKPVDVPKFVVPKPEKEEGKDAKKKDKKKKEAKKPGPPKPTVIAFGAGVHYSFGCSTKDGKIRIAGPVKVLGKAGEKYVGLRDHITAYLIEDDPKKKKKAKVQVARFNVKEDGSIAGAGDDGVYSCDVPTDKKTKKPLKGAYVIQLHGSLPGFGRVYGQEKLKL